MGDERLRELERTWRTSGAVQDKVRWLSERIRSGLLTERATVAAAILGDEAAVELQEGDPVVHAQESTERTIYMASIYMEPDGWLRLCLCGTTKAERTTVLDCVADWDRVQEVVDLQWRRRVGTRARQGWLFTLAGLVGQWQRRQDLWITEAPTWPLWVLAREVLEIDAGQMSWAELLVRIRVQVVPWLLETEEPGA